MNNIEKLIKKRKNKEKLNYDDFVFLVKNYSNDKISDSEMTVFLKDVFSNDLSDNETLDWFEAILKNDIKIIDFSFCEGFKVDKHSTGGVGDNITLILLPLLSSFGIKVFKLSGKFLGHTGGTITKLNSFKNIKLDITIKEFKEKTKTNNLVLSKVINNISNFEKKIYSLRNKTNTTKSVPLIFTSIMIKKLFIKVDLLIIDLKIGSGSLFKTEKETYRFANLIKKIAIQNKRKLLIFITNMDQPLGLTVGNKMEVLETIKILEGSYFSDDIKEIVLEMSSQVLLASGKFKEIKKAKEEILKKLMSGEVIKYFRHWIESMGGDFDSINKNRKINCKYKVSIKANKEGFVKILNNTEIGNFLNKINNSKSKDNFDFEAGIEWFKKNNIKVKKDDVIFNFYTNQENIDELKMKADKLFVINQNKSKLKPIIIETFFIK